MIQQFIKATLDNGVSGYDHSFTYKLGKNDHPAPDRESKSSCGVGIHLAKTIKVAKQYVTRATEFYLATPIEILGEDRDKVRCAGCELVRKLSKEEVRQWDKQPKPLGFRLPFRPSLCDEWLDKHLMDISVEDISKQTITVFKEDRKRAIIPAMTKRKRIKELIKASVQ